MAARTSSMKPPARRCAAMTKRLAKFSPAYATAYGLHPTPPRSSQAILLTADSLSWLRLFELLFPLSARLGLGFPPQAFAKLKCWARTRWQEAREPSRGSHVRTFEMGDH